MNGGGRKNLPVEDKRSYYKPKNGSRSDGPLLLVLLRLHLPLGIFGRVMVHQLPVSPGWFGVSGGNSMLGLRHPEWGWGPRRKVQPSQENKGLRGYYISVADQNPTDMPGLQVPRLLSTSEDDLMILKLGSSEKYSVMDVESTLPPLTPDICVVNFYSKSSRLGVHQDKNESKESLRKGLPVVSISIGDSAEFVYGDQGDVDKLEKVVLESGDILIFGGRSRLVFHGVTTIKPDTAPKVLLEETNLRPGRINLTFRQFQ
ncbi:hypothetical protein Leryth_010196 [Lithospermum erythrorhizon]|nr:hypothetical protein Leryth_010196 [Lithospermum erythrorhizon]